MTPENRLLLLLARGRLTPEASSRALSLATRQIAWRALLEQARVHEVLPLVYRNLRALECSCVPEQIRAELETAHRKNALRNAVLARELTAVLRLFDESRVPVIPLKGVTLAQYLYGDLTLRMCRDLDVFVPRSFAAKALRLLLDRGYSGRCAQPFIANVALRYGIECNLTREEDQFPYMLELHSGLFAGTSSENDAIGELWAQAQPKIFFGVQALAMSPECELLFFAVHAARHQWQGLKWIVDIHEMCTQAAIDWQKLQETAIRLGWDEILAVSLAASRALCETEFPPNLSLKPLPSWLQLFPAECRSIDGPTMTAFIVRLLKRRSEKLDYLARALLTPTTAEAHALPLPAGLSFLYYPFRPVRLLTRWVARSSAPAPPAAAR